MRDDFQARCENAGLSPGVVDADLEGLPLPSEQTVDEVRETIERVMEWRHPETTLETYRRLEAGNRQRAAVIDAIEQAL